MAGIPKRENTTNYPVEPTLWNIRTKTYYLIVRHLLYFIYVDISIATAAILLGTTRYTAAHMCDA